MEIQMARVKTFVILSVSMMAAAAPEAFASVTPVSTCGAVLSAPGKYSLSGDLLACPGPAIVIAASDISLDLKGNEITCDRADGQADIGILGTNVSSVEVRNGRISSCEVGIQFSNVKNSKVTDLSVHGGTRDPVLGFGGAAILLLGSDNNSVIGNRAIGNIIGIGIFNSNDNRVAGNVTSENVGYLPFVFGMGIALSASSTGNSVIGNESRLNSDAGIVLSIDVSNTTVRGNEVSDNGYYGIGAFTRTDVGAPSPENNLIQGNSSLANGRADLVEILFHPLTNPRESIAKVCKNSWIDNTFVSLMGPNDCVR
jgi:parallel beta-helix repeat protein